MTDRLRGQGQGAPGGAFLSVLRGLPRIDRLGDDNPCTNVGALAYGKAWQLGCADANGRRGFRWWGL